MIRTYHLERSGESRFAVLGANHCGPATAVEPDNCVPMRWVVRMECGPGSLDPRGFMVDQVALAEYVDRYAATPSASSCELAAEHLCESIAAWARRENPDILITFVHVELRSAPYRGAIAHTVRYL